MRGGSDLAMEDKLVGDKSIMLLALTPTNLAFGYIYLFQFSDDVCAVYWAIYKPSIKNILIVYF